MTKRKPVKSHAEAKCVAKHAYVSERIAGIRADQLTEQRGVKLYAYRCTICKQWHHTKQLRQNRKKRETGVAA